MIPSIPTNISYIKFLKVSKGFWKDSNFVTKPLPENLKQFKVDNELISVENQSDRWVAEDSNCYYYDLTSETSKTSETSNNQ